MNIFLELAKQGYQFSIQPMFMQRIKITILGTTDEGKKAIVNAVMVLELIEDEESVTAFVNQMIKNLKTKI